MLRTTLIRAGLLAVLALALAALWWAQSYVRPEAVRATVLESFHEQFPDAHVHVGEAHLRVFGGVNVRDLTMARDDDASPFFSAPSATIAHDKEELSSGRMVIRKIELDGATLKVERRADGRWSFEGLSRPSPADRPMPMLVVKHGTISLIDKSTAGLPPVTFTDANFVLINDPPPLHLQVKGSAMMSVSANGLNHSPIRVELIGRLHRLTGEFNFRVAATEVTLGPDLARVLALWQPRLADPLKGFTATANVRAEVSYKPDALQPFTYDLEVNVKQGHFSDPILPVPIECLEGTIRYKDGKITVNKATAKLGTSTAELSFETRTIPTYPPATPPPSGLVPGTLTSTVRRPPPADAFEEIEEKLEKLDLTIRDLTLTDDLFARLGERGQVMQRRFSPVGVVAVSYRFQRPGSSGWRRDFEIRPVRFGLTYEKFRYPMHDTAGFIRKTVTHTGTDETRIDLSGTVAGQRVDVKGTVAGTGPDPAIDLRISGTNLPIDDRLFDALPKEKHREALKKLHAVGRADIVAEVKQTQNVNRTESTFRFSVYEGRFCPSQFPYPMTNVSGQVAIQVTSVDDTRPTPNEPDTDRVTIDNFVGTHGQGSVKFKGVQGPIAGTDDSKFTLNVVGTGCPLDTDFEKSLSAIRMDAVWRTFSPRGTITFAVDVELYDRVAAAPAILPPPFVPHAPPRASGRLMNRAKSGESLPFNAATDLKLTLHFTGPSVTPDFFPYDLDAVCGRVRYDGTQVRVERFTARHGTSHWALEAGDVRFYDDGRVWANIGKLDVSPMAIDEAFLKALPPTLSNAMKQINLRGDADLTLRHLVVLSPPPAKPPVQVAGFVTPQPSTTPPDPDIYWTGELKLRGAALDAGISWDKIQGRLASTGRYYGTHLGEVVGNLWLDEALAAEQPVKNVKLTYRADPQTPDPAKPGQYEPVAVKLTDLNGSFFGGAVGGEARVVLSDPVRYRIRLDVTDVKLEDLAKHHELTKTSRVEGIAQASIRLETVPDGKGGYTRDGAGSFDVDHGHLLNLPFLLPLLKTLKLQAPDKTAFEEAHAAFTIKNDRVHVTHLDLLGDAISVGGSGETDFDGKNLQFDCYVIWSQTLHRWLTTPIGDLSAFVSEKLFRIEIKRGADGQMKYDARLVPFVTDPIRAIAERANRRKTALANPKGAP